MQQVPSTSLGYWSGLPEFKGYALQPSEPEGMVSSHEYYVLSHLDRGALASSTNPLLITTRQGVLFTEVNISHAISLTMTLFQSVQVRCEVLNLSTLLCNFQFPHPKEGVIVPTPRIFVKIKCNHKKKIPIF